MASRARNSAGHAPPQVFAAPDCQRLALLDQERLSVAALLPREFPAYPPVYYYFRRWQADGRWVELNRALGRRHQRAAPQRQPAQAWPCPMPNPSSAVNAGCWGRALTVTKKFQGRKRQLPVDTGGWQLAARVGPAHENDRVGGQAALRNLHQLGFERLHLVLADAGYDGQYLAEWARDHCGRRLETAPGPTGSGSFTPVPTRWVSGASSAGCDGTGACESGPRVRDNRCRNNYLPIQHSTPYPQILTGSECKP